jgi:hypothetical protein
MTDVVQSPTPSTPPPATVDAPLYKQDEWVQANERIAAQADPDHKALERLESLPAEEAARAAARIQKKRREREGVTDPVIERKYSEPLKLDRDDEEAAWEGAKSLKEASKDLSFSRLMARGTDLLNAGFSTNDAIAVVNAELAQGKPSQMPLTKIGLVREDGTLVNELADHDGPILGMDESVAFKNPKDAARFVGNYRDALARQQQALLDELQQRQVAEQQEAEEQQRQAAEAEQAKLAEQKRVQKAKEVEAERAKVAQLQWENQATNEEKRLVDKDKEWFQWASRQPEMMSHEALAHTQRTNPQRYTALMREVARYKQFQQAAISRIGEIGEIKRGRALQQHAQVAAAREQFNKAEDEKFNEALKCELPAFANGKAKAVLREAAREELRALGLSDEQISHEYNWGNLRSAAGQMLVAKAAVGRLARNARVELAEGRAPVPPVLTPGTVRPRGAAEIESVRSLERQLAGAKGTAALKIARQLTQARRAAGLT